MICKKYIDPNGDATGILLNESYKNQLNTFVKCASNKSKIESLNYYSNDLIDYFNSVNQCQGDTSNKKKSKKQETTLFYKLALNTNFSNMDLKLKNGLYEIPFDGNNTTEKKTTFSIGFELELILPFNNKKWSVFMEPSFTSYSGNGIMTSTYYINPNYVTGYTNNDYSIQLKYQSINIPLGVKRNFYFNKLSRFYLSTALNFQIPNNSNITILRKNNTVLISSSITGTKLNFFLSIGYQYKKIIAELRQYTNTNLNPYTDSNSYAFKNASLILKYQFN